MEAIRRVMGPLLPQTHRQAVVDDAPKRAQY